MNLENCTRTFLMRYCNIQGKSENKIAKNVLFKTKVTFDCAFYNFPVVEFSI